MIIWYFYHGPEAIQDLFLKKKKKKLFGEQVMILF